MLEAQGAVVEESNQKTSSPPLGTPRESDYNANPFDDLDRAITPEQKLGAILKRNWAFDVDGCQPSLPYHARLDCAERKGFGYTLSYPADCKITIVERQPMPPGVKRTWDGRVDGRYLLARETTFDLDTLREDKINTSSLLELYFDISKSYMPVVRVSMSDAPEQWIALPRPPLESDFATEFPDREARNQALSSAIQLWSQKITSYGRLTLDRRSLDLSPQFFKVTTQAMGGLWYSHSDGGAIVRAAQGRLVDILKALLTKCHAKSGPNEPAGLRSTPDTRVVASEATAEESERQRIASADSVKLAAQALENARRATEDERIEALQARRADEAANQNAQEQSRLYLTIAGGIIALLSVAIVILIFGKRRKSTVVDHSAEGIHPASEFDAALATKKSDKSLHGTKPTTLVAQENRSASVFSEEVQGASNTEGLANLGREGMRKPRVAAVAVVSFLACCAVVYFAIHPMGQTLHDFRPFNQMTEFAKGLVSSHALQLSGPDFKVRHVVNEVQAGCTPGYNPTGTQCLQHDHTSVASLTIQSANDYPVLLREIVINEKPQCSVKPNKSLTLGDTYDVSLGACDPLKVRIVTDHGEAIYSFN